jgi:hypothetical protein
MQRGVHCSLGALSSRSPASGHDQTAAGSHRIGSSSDKSSFPLSNRPGLPIFTSRFGEAKGAQPRSPTHRADLPGFPPRPNMAGRASEGQLDQRNKRSSGPLRVHLRSCRRIVSDIPHPSPARRGRKIARHCPAPGCWPELPARSCTPAPWRNVWRQIATRTIGPGHRSHAPANLAARSRRSEHRKKPWPLARKTQGCAAPRWPVRCMLAVSPPPVHSVSRRMLPDVMRTGKSDEYRREA